MPYPIPPKPWSEEFEYVLVALPSDRGFLRAAWGMFSDLGSKHQWGLEGLEADSQDAADHWLQAVGETFTLMGKIDDLLSYVDDVETLLSALRANQCCSSPYIEPGLPSDQLPQSSDTNPPTVWGDETIADPWTWQDYKCEGAHLAVDLAKNVLERLGTLDEQPEAEEAAALVGYVFVIYKFFGIASKLIEAILNADWSVAAGFQDAITNIEASRDTIACAVHAADGAEAAADAMRAAVLDAVDSETFVKTFVAPYLPYELWMKLVYEGTAEDVHGDAYYLDDHITLGAHACCAPTVETTYLFGTDREGWAGWSYGAGEEIGANWIRFDDGDAVTIQYPVTDETTLRLSIRAWYATNPPESCTARLSVKATGADPPSDYGDVVIPAYDPEPYDNWYTVDLDVSGYAGQSPVVEIKCLSRTSLHKMYVGDATISLIP